LGSSFILLSNVSLSMNIWWISLPSRMIVYYSIISSKKSLISRDILYRFSNSRLYIILLLVFIFFMALLNYNLITFTFLKPYPEKQMFFANE